MVVVVVCFLSAIVVAGANVADFFKLLEETLSMPSSWSSAPLPLKKRLSSSSSSTCVSWAKATTTTRQPERARRTTEELHIPHIRGIGEERFDDDASVKGYPARRWVVERTGAYYAGLAFEKPGDLLGALRDKKAAKNYLLGLNKVACILLWYRRQRRLSLLR